MAKEVIKRKNESSQFIFCYWDDYSTLPQERIKNIKTKTKIRK
jgi:hypothetical protein